MSELGIYEGCYALLRNGEIVGPISKDHATSSDYIWDGPEGTSWTAAGTVWISSFCDRDIVRVGPRELLKVTEMEASEKPHWDMCATIPPHVTKAAMDAGIKADPAYEQFVNAILTAGFKAQYGIGFVPVTEQAPISVTDELLEQISSVFGDKGFYELGDTAQQKLRGAAECAVAFLGGKRVVLKNESENRIPDSEKPKGGLSDFLPFHEPGLAEKITDTGREVLKSMLPLNGATICFTGSMKMPVDTHKGIAEALGAKVSGSVHSNTTLVVFGVNALSKLDKAIEHNLPRMSESGWLWMAALLGYGKPDHVSPYGKLAGSKCLPIPSVRTIDEAIRGAVQVWRQNNPVGGVPPTHYIAKSVHAAISDVAPVHNAGLIPPTGWTLEKETHELINDNWQHTVRLIKGFDEATWVEGKAYTLCDAWENARQAARQHNG